MGDDKNHEQWPQEHTGGEQPGQPEGGGQTEQPAGGGQQGQPAGEAQPIAPVQPETDKDAKMWAMFCHLAGLAGLLPVLPIIGSVIAPLIIWQIKKDEFSFVDEQGKEAVNFQISMLIYFLIGSVACAITCIGVALIPVVIGVVGIVDVVFLLIAAVKSNNGAHYRYPLSIRLIK
jgi:uncharacterized Tic20 family protein